MRRISGGQLNLLSEKEKNTNSNIQLIENGHTITKRDEIAECFNSYFTTITEMLNIEEAPTSKVTEPFCHPVLDAVRKFRLHQSIVKIKQMTGENGTFELRPFEPAEVWDEINRLDTTLLRRQVGMCLHMFSNQLLTFPSVL